MREAGASRGGDGEARGPQASTLAEAGGGGSRSGDFRTSWGMEVTGLACKDPGGLVHGSRAQTPGRGSGCKHLARVFPVLPDQRGPPGTFLVLPLSRPGDRDPDGSESGRSGRLLSVLNLSITQKSSFYQPVFTDKETQAKTGGLSCARSGVREGQQGRTRHPDLPLQQRSQ